MSSKGAARKDDATTHGGSISTAATNVRVNERGAARMGDQHVCALTTPNPHVGGPIRFGGAAALTVLINRRPGVAIDGASTCLNAPFIAPNTVAVASTNVFYAVSSTIAGLEVSEGADGAIHIGRGIVIRGSVDYQAQVLADLAKVASTDIGRRRLQSLDASGHTVTIVPWTGKERNASCTASSSRDARSVKAGGTGEGCDSEVAYSPGIWPPDPGAVSTTTGAEGDVILFHELNHADHAAHGTQDLTPRQDAYDNQEEFNSIEPDENTYRDKRGFPPRHTHKHS